MDKVLNHKSFKKNLNNMKLQNHQEKMEMEMDRKKSVSKNGNSATVQVTSPAPKQGASALFDVAFL